MSNNITSINQYELEVKKFLLRSANKVANTTPKKFADRIMDLIKDKIPVSDVTTYSVYIGYASDSWTISKDAQRKWVIGSKMDGYNYNYVLEYGGNPWAKKGGTAHLTPDGFSTQAPSGFIRLAIDQATREFNNGAFV